MPIFDRRIISKDACVHLLSFGVYRPTLRPRAKNWIGCPSDFRTTARSTSMARTGRRFRNVFSQRSLAYRSEHDGACRRSVALIDDVFVDISKAIRTAWPVAYCGTSEFWETEVGFPTGVYIPTEERFVRSSIRVADYRLKVWGGQF
jgi:hypothetical protein